MYGTQNPFEEEEARQPLMTGQPSQPSYLRHSQNLSAAAPAAAAAPPPVPQKDQAAAADMLDRRARELDARERELSRREAEARQMEEDARRTAAEAGTGSAPDPRAPNWPPCFPKKLVYQDFEVDIPAEVRPRVRMSYYHVLAQGILLLFNMLCGLAVMFGADVSALGDMIVACVMVVVVSALAFFGYRQLYKAARTGSSLAYGVFMACMVVEIVVGALAALGWPGTGFLGIKRAVEMFAKKKKAVGFMCLADGLLWAAATAVGVFLLIRIRVNFARAGGMKAFKAQAAERATTGAINFAKEHPDAAKKAGKAAVNYARENPEVFKEAAKGAASAVRESNEATHILA